MMKIQGLAVIAIIILLPMTLILSSYISSQAKTLDYQVEYDSRLQNSTYDALKAFQMNTANSDTSDIANSKIRDVKAGANSFFNSLANNFNMPGYDKEALSSFVPAVVFTMYDGYYIYAPYTNTLDDLNKNYAEGGVEMIVPDTNRSDDAAILDYKGSDEYKTQDGKQGAKDIRYKDGQDLTGLKPYVYYSARYVKEGDGIDVTITYALDNYIVIHGKKGNDTIDISGYLLTDVKYNGADNDKPGKDATAEYRGITISVEGASDDTLIKERTFISKAEDTGETSGETSPAVSVRAVVPCRMINGVRYYNIGQAFPGTSANNPQGIWALLNGSWRQQNYESITENLRGQLDINKVRASDVQYNSNAVEYYKDAAEFKTEIKNAGLEDLRIGDMMINYIAKSEDDEGTNEVKNISYYDYYNLYKNEKNSSKSLSYLGNPGDKIFKGLDKADVEEGIYIEEPESNFNNHRLGIIRYSIEKNLAVAINNFNVYSESSINFEMPKLSEEEWDDIYDNLCVISFLQGLSIGGKVYSGHAVVPNTDNKEVVTEDSIYIAGSASGYTDKIYKATYKKSEPFVGTNSSYARWKMDFKRAATEDVNNGTIEYFYRYPEKSNYATSAGLTSADGNLSSITGDLLTSNKVCLRYTWGNSTTNLLDGEKDEAWYAYDSIVTTTGNDVLGSDGVQDNMYDYMEQKYNAGGTDKDIAIAYFTALARARWGMYRVENPVFTTAYLKQE